MTTVTGTGFVGMGTLGIGELSMKITMSDQTVWDFTGAIVGLNVVFNLPIETATFDGYDHIAGFCSFAYGSMAIGVGVLAVKFFDTQGSIGNVVTGVWGLSSFPGGAGFGRWTQIG